MSSRAWIASLAALVALRVAIPLVALAASGHDLPGLPPYTYVPLNGDATGFYAESRELISVAFGPAGAVAVLLLCAGAWLAWRLRPAWKALVAGAFAVSLAATALVLGSVPSGAAVVGWPLLWAIPLLPFRVLGVLDADLAFAVGLPILLAANAVTVVATAVIGFRASGRRWIGVAAAALFAVWPLLARAPGGSERVGERPVARRRRPPSLHGAALDRARGDGDRAPARTAARRAAAGPGRCPARLRDRGQGLERPVCSSSSRPRRTSRRAAESAPIRAGRARVRAARRRLLAEGLSRDRERPGFSLAQASRSWGADTLIFDPRTVALLLPLAVLGTLALRPWTSALLVAVIATNVGLYTFYEHTHLHPRFLYVALPALFVLEAAGAGLVIRKVSRGTEILGL